MTPAVAVVIVNYNGRQFLPRVLECLEKQTLGPDAVELLLLDNGSTDGSLDEVRRHHPRVRADTTDRNNFARALNTGAARAAAPYVLYLNNDMYLAPDWLERAVEILDGNPQIAALQGKIYFAEREGVLNSVGARLRDDYFAEDIGFNQRDVGQFDEPADRLAVTNGCAIYRKAALEAIGGVDEDFIMYAEDMDLGFRLARGGHTVWYDPRLVSHHQFHATASARLCDWFMNRNRLLFLAKHFPETLPYQLDNAHFYLWGEDRALQWALAEAVTKLFRIHGTGALDPAQGVMEFAVTHYGVREAARLFARVRRWLDDSDRLHISIYDHTVHSDAANPVALALAAAFGERHRVRVMAHQPFRLADRAARHGLALDAVDLEVVDLPPFRDRDTIDPQAVTPDRPNWFDLVAHRAEGADFFINASGVTRVYPTGAYAALLCANPQGERDEYFFADRYDLVVPVTPEAAAHLRGHWDLDERVTLSPPAKPDSLAEHLAPTLAQIERALLHGIQRVEDFTLLYQV